MCPDFIVFFAEMQSEQAHSATIYPRVHHAHHPETYKVSDTYWGDSENYKR